MDFDQVTKIYPERVRGRLDIAEGEPASSSPVRCGNHACMIAGSRTSRPA
jgi:hypothetical protein